MFQLKVPFLRDSDIQSAVSELTRKCASVGIPMEPPIPIDDIVEKYLKLDFALADLKAELGLSDVLGATWFDEQRVRVDESLEGQEGRYSFTLAHEVGHWILHRPLHEMDKVTLPLFSREEVTTPPAIVCRGTQRKAPMELQADRFASFLLMPSRLVRLALRSSAGADCVVIDGFDGNASGASLSALRTLATKVIDQGKFSNVSNEAMRVRLVELKLISSTRPLPSAR